MIGETSEGGDLIFLEDHHLAVGRVKLVLEVVLLGLATPTLPLMMVAVTLVSRLFLELDMDDAIVRASRS